MPLPKSVVKYNRHGVRYVSNVDAVKYTIAELTRRALIDVGKVIRKMVVSASKKGLRGMARSKRPYNLQYWARKKENDLLIGYKHDTWYAAQAEMGTGSMGDKRRGYLRDTVHDNVDLIVEIESQYLSALSKEKPL